MKTNRLFSFVALALLFAALSTSCVPEPEPVEPTCGADQAEIDGCRTSGGEWDAASCRCLY